MLSEKQWRTIDALVDRIIPTDDYPGGWEMGAADYLRRQMAGGDLADKVAVYHAGLNALDAEAHWNHERGFVELDTASQDALLARIETGAVSAEWPMEAQEFFGMLVRHTMEGFYADPGNGGNRGKAAWAMIGFEVRG